MAFRFKAFIVATGVITIAIFSLRPVPYIYVPRAPSLRSCRTSDGEPKIPECLQTSSQTMKDNFVPIETLFLPKHTSTELKAYSQTAHFRPLPSESANEVHRPKDAFATFLTSSTANNTNEDDNSDNYFVAVRILIYQILHAPETRSQRRIPFVALVTEEVSERKRRRLQKDGAIVRVVKRIHGDGWEDAILAHWTDVLTKLRLWELTNYDRIAFIDADTILAKPIDGVFDDPAVAEQKTATLLNQVDDIQLAAEDEGASLLPSTYLFAAITQVAPLHSFPPTISTSSFPNTNYLNAGFMVLRPSRAVFEYYISLTKLPGGDDARFNHDLPEQNLLNYAHRREGSMPWQALDTRWNLQWPTMADLQGGVISLHDKWWGPVATPELGGWYQSWRWRMEGFWEGVGNGKEEEEGVLKRGLGSQGRGGYNGVVREDEGIKDD